MRERDVDSEVAKKYDRVVERVTGSLEFLQGIRGTGVCTTKGGAGVQSTDMRLKQMGVFWKEGGRKNGLETPRRSVEGPSSVSSGKRHVGESRYHLRGPIPGRDSFS